MSHGRNQKKKKRKETNPFTGSRNPSRIDRVLLSMLNTIIPRREVINLEEIHRMYFRKF